ncbi:hypothetical protein GF327_10410 [Candidatus Woesearchaeota archaeon]|nr:hypothetical protein [Candidatus Woesearchaeota archaeon]
MTEQKDVSDELLKNQKFIEEVVKKILKDEKKILKEILREEKEIKKEEEIIKDVENKIEKKENQIEELINKKIVSRKYNDILDWKKYVWDGCEYKVKKEANKEINFVCKKLKKICNFTSCPLNFI